MADDANSVSDLGEPTVTAGRLGNGKSIPSNSAMGPSKFILGLTSSVGNEAIMPNDK